MRLRFLLLLIGTLALPAAAQGVDWQARIDAALKTADRAAAWQRSHASAEHPAGPTVRIGKLPVPAAGGKSGIDLNALAARFQSELDRDERGPAAPGGLSVFVSMSMPRASLERLVAGAARTRTTLVLRGMVDHSIVKTARAVHGLIGNRRVAWTIDPDAFRRFGVNAVPVFVLTRTGIRSRPCGDDRCMPVGGYVRLAGDVSIGYALDAIARLQPDFRDAVEQVRGGR